MSLTTEQAAAGCWLCACEAVRMMWDFCMACGETVDSRLTPERRAEYRRLQGWPPEADAVDFSRSIPPLEAVAVQSLTPKAIR